MPQGRVIFLAIDERSMSEQAMMPSLADARRFVDLLLPEDYLGLIGFPTGRTYINPTHDRARVRDALTPALRHDALKTAKFSFLPSEIVDITVGDARVLAKVDRANVCGSEACCVVIRFGLKRGLLQPSKGARRASGLPR